MNIYAGVPDNLTDVFLSIQTKAFEQQIRQAIEDLTSGKGGRYEAVIMLLGAFVGEGPEDA